MFVREPFERLLSAYKSKIANEDAPNDNYFTDNFGRYILRHYRPGALERDIQRGRGVTFKEFINYLMNPTWRGCLQHYQPCEEDQRWSHTGSDHWVPQVWLSDPCHLHFDFIGKYETLDEDIEYLLHLLGEELIQFPPSKRKSQVATKLLVPRYYGQLAPKSLETLWNIYKYDYEIFGYSYPDAVMNRKKIN